MVLTFISLLINLFFCPPAKFQARWLFPPSAYFWVRIWNANFLPSDSRPRS